MMMDNQSLNHGMGEVVPPANGHGRDAGSTGNQPDGPAAPRRGRLRRLLRRLGISLVLVLAVFFAGFLYFANLVSSLTPPADIKADAIVVLTGGSQRLNQAIDLLVRGAGQRLLITGVHPATTPGQIRRLTRSSSVIFHCCVDIGYEALDTIGNAAEAVTWIRKHGYRKVLVVTNNYHMPRSLIELRRADPEIDFVAYPVVNSDLKRRNWFADPKTLRVMLSEYLKILATGVSGFTGFVEWPGAKPHTAPGQHDSALARGIAGEPRHLNG
nr:YdcF family protein [uncultured Gellertiella sp.]